MGASVGILQPGEKRWAKANLTVGFLGCERQLLRGGCCSGAAVLCPLSRPSNPTVPHVLVAYANAAAACTPLQPLGAFPTRDPHACDGHVMRALKLFCTWGRQSCPRGHLSPPGNGVHNCRPARLELGGPHSGMLLSRGQKRRDRSVVGMGAWHWGYPGCTPLPHGTCLATALPWLSKSTSQLRWHHRSTVGGLRMLTGMTGSDSHMSLLPCHLSVLQLRHLTS